MYVVAGIYYQAAMGHMGQWPLSPIYNGFAPWQSIKAGLTISQFKDTQTAFQNRSSVLLNNSPFVQSRI